MDQLIPKPFKRFIINSKNYAKHQIGEFYGYNTREDSLIMADLKSTIRSTKVKYVNNYINKDLLDNSCERHNIIFNESYVINETDLSGLAPLDKSLSTNNNNTIELLTVKLIPSPEKNAVKYLDIEQIDKLDQESNTNNELKVDGSSFGLEFNKNCINKEYDNLIELGDMKNNKTVIKVKVIIPKNNSYKEIEINSNNIQTTDLDDISNKSDLFYFPPNQNSDNINTKIKNCMESTNICIDKTESPKILQTTDLDESFEPNEKNINNFNDTNQSECIFEENKIRPLSPIPSEKTTEIFPKVNDLVNFHEKISELSLEDSLKKYSIPIMGKATLLAKVTSPDQATLNDSQIIHKLVHDRFVINTFESRTNKKTIKKPSRYGRIYKSLERKLKNDTENDQLSNTIHTDSPLQSSPIKLPEEFISLNTNILKDQNIAKDLTNNSYITCKEELSEPNKNDKMSNCGSEYSCGSQSENCSTIEDFSSLSRYQTPNYFKLYDENVILEESVGNDNTPGTNPIENESKEHTIGTEASYDMEEFLKKALGDELINEVSSYIAQEEKKPLESKQISAEDSVCTSDASDLISKIHSFRSSFYRSLTKRLRHMSHSMHSTSAERVEASEEDLNSLLPNNERVTDLVRQAAVQYEAMKQISKALTLCRNMKEFVSSVEQIEGERLLLLAIHRRQALLNEIRQLDYELVNTSPALETGSVTITDMSFPLKKIPDSDSRRDQKQWFVCLVSQGPQVQATQCILTPDNNELSFTEEITFKDLPSDFIISVEIYSLLQRRNIRNFSHESKYHLNKETKNSLCPGPKNLIQKEKRNSQKCLTRADTGIHTSSFKLNGVIKLRVFDIKNVGPWQMRKVPLSSFLDGTVTMRMRNQVQVLVKHSGFMTVGKNISGSIAWNRRWCLLKGNLMFFWNYPCDEDSICPLEIVDLRRCMNALIESVDRSICPKPRTLLLETIENNEKDLEKHFLSFDTLSDMHSWEEELNKVVNILRTWNDSYLN